MPAKIYACTECGQQYMTKVIRCTECEQYNTVVEVQNFSKSSPVKSVPTKPKRYSEIIFSQYDRTSTGFQELDRVLGGGIVAGSVTVLGSDAGKGKTTLLFGLASNWTRSGKTVLYVSSEETEEQLKLRTQEMDLSFGDELYILNKSQLHDILDIAYQMKPDLMIIDSINRLRHVDSQTPNQKKTLDLSVTDIIDFSKETGIPVYVVSHVNADGEAAGSRQIEYIPDVMLYLEAQGYGAYRIVRCAKNRYGNADEIGVFKMTENGMSEVVDAATEFIKERPVNAAGSVISTLVDKTRPLIIELQALTSHSSGNPMRRSTGFSRNTLEQICAVVGRLPYVDMFSTNVHFSVAGGLQVKDTASYLAACIAIVSSYSSVPAPAESAFIGEVGLVGEIRDVSNIKRRVSELYRAGFSKIIIPDTSEKLGKKLENVCVRCKTLDQAVRATFGEDFDYTPIQYVRQDN